MPDDSTHKARNFKIFLLKKQYVFKYVQNDFFPNPKSFSKKSKKIMYTKIKSIL